MAVKSVLPRSTPPKRVCSRRVDCKPVDWCQFGGIVTGSKLVPS
ncbi:MAG: hypothetical protein ACTSUE_15260 [Promethearchaeota archaeon]